MKLFIVFMFASFFLSASSHSLERPSGSDLSLVLHLNPITRTPHNELGFSFGVGLAPYDFDAMNFRLMVEPTVIWNIPYKTSGGNLKDLAVVAPILFGFTPQFFAGFVGGVAMNFSSTAIPVLFVGGEARYFLLKRFFVQGDVGYSASGNHYLNAGIGYAW